MADKFDLVLSLNKYPFGVFETRFGYLINGYYYDKGLNCYDSKVCNIDHYHDIFKLSIATVADLNTKYRETSNIYNDTYIYKDENIPNVFYALSKGIPSTSGISYNYSCDRIIALEEKDKDIKQLWYFTSSAQNNSTIRFLGQNLTKLFIADGRDIYILRKSDGAILARTNDSKFLESSSHPSNTSSHPMIFKTIYDIDNILYIIAFRSHLNNNYANSYNDNYIFKVNKDANTIEFYVLPGSNYTTKVIKNIADDGTETKGNVLTTCLGHTINDNIILKDNKVIIYLPFNITIDQSLNGTNGYNQSNFFNQLMTFTIDFNNPEWPPKISTNIIDIKVPELRVLENTHWITKRFWTMEDNKYLVFVNSREYFDNTMPNIPYQGIHIFELSEDCQTPTYLCTDRCSKTDEIKTFIYTSNKEILLVCYSRCFMIYKWNYDTHKYEYTKSFVQDVHSCGFDELDRLWIHTFDKQEIHVYNLDDPLSVNIKFELPYYSYNDEDINTYILFEALNFFGKHVKGKFLFTLYGDAVFDESGTEKLEYEYTIEDKAKIPITIKNINGVQCHVKFMSIITNSSSSSP